MAGTIPPDWGKRVRFDDFVDGPVEELPDWVVQDMAEHGDEAAEAELRRRGIPEEPLDIPRGQPL